MRLFIADDEALARRRLRRLLLDSAHEVVGEAGDGAAALQAIRQLKPDVVLLDIRMPVLDGLAVARQLSEEDYPPAVIFLTAFTAHMQEAFDVNARNYLLKPVRKRDLLNSIERVRRMDRVQLEAARQDLQPDTNEAFLPCSDHGHIIRVALGEIIYCQAREREVSIYRPGETLLSDLSLREIESRLPQLLRIHRQTLINPHWVESLLRNPTGEGWQVRLRRVSEPLEISRRLLTQVRQRLDPNSENTP